MEEDEYRNTYQQINPIRCAFEKAILSRRCACGHAHKFCLAEREGVSCGHTARQARCAHFLSSIRKQAMFVLKLTSMDNTMQLPHAKEIRVQVGSLLGLNELLQLQPGADQIADINDLLDKSTDKYRDINELPFSQLIPAIQKMEGRRSRRR